MKEPSNPKDRDKAESLEARAARIAHAPARPTRPEEARGPREPARSDERFRDERPREARGSSDERFRDERPREARGSSDERSSQREVRVREVRVRDVRVASRDAHPRDTSPRDPSPRERLRDERPAALESDEGLLSRASRLARQLGETISSQPPGQENPRRSAVRTSGSRERVTAPLRERRLPSPSPEARGQRTEPRRSLRDEQLSLPKVSPREDKPLLESALESSQRTFSKLASAMGRAISSQPPDASSRPRRDERQTHDERQTRDEQPRRAERPKVREDRTRDDVSSFQQERMRDEVPSFRDEPASRTRSEEERPGRERSRLRADASRSTSRQSEQEPSPRAERPGTERPGTERPGTERPGTERTSTERSSTERTSTERSSLTTTAEQLRQSISSSLDTYSTGLRKLLTSRDEEGATTGRPAKSARPSRVDEEARSPRPQPSPRVERRVQDAAPEPTPEPTPERPASSRPRPSMEELQARALRLARAQRNQSEGAEPSSEASVSRSGGLRRALTSRSEEDDARLFEHLPDEAEGPSPAMAFLRKAFDLDQAPEEQDPALFINPLLDPKAPAEPSPEPEPKLEVAPPTRPLLEAVRPILPRRFRGEKEARREALGERTARIRPSRETFESVEQLRARRRAEREAQQERRKALVKRMATACLAALGALALVIGGLEVKQYLEQAPWLALETITISGTQKAKEWEVKVLSEATLGKNLLALDPETIATQIERHPWIADADVRRSFPHALNITVREREPVAILPLGELYYVDKEGTVFKKVKPGDPLNLPMLTGFDTQAALQRGIIGRKAIQEALVLLERVQEKTRFSLEQISEVHVDVDRGYSLFTTNAVTQIAVGWDNFDQKLERLMRLLDVERVDLAQVKHIDMDLSRFAVVTPL